MKKSAKVLLYFGLDCGMMKFFTYKLQSQEQLLNLLHFWSTVRQKKLRFVPIQPVIQQGGLLESFLYKAAQNFDLISNIQD